MLFVVQKSSGNYINMDIQLAILILSIVKNGNSFSENEVAKKILANPNFTYTSKEIMRFNFIFHISMLTKAILILQQLKKT